MSSRKSTASASKTSAPPPASSWAAPPEFYLDENSVTRRVRDLLRGLGYVVHTPAELYGTREEALGAPDTDWLSRVRGSGWVVVGRDAKILHRPYELEAYRKAQVHMVLLPGEATAQQLVDLLAASLADICAVTSSKRPDVWRITSHGVRRR